MVCKYSAPRHLEPPEPASTLMTLPGSNRPYDLPVRGMRKHLSVVARR